MALLVRRRSAASAGHGRQEVTPRRPHAGLLRLERRDLRTSREQLLRRLGGLMVEMYRRDEFRGELLEEACDLVLAIDDRVAEIDAVLDARRRPRACACGTRLVAGASFCPSCGRDLTRAPAPPPEPWPEEG